jgi:hypothetical protein
MTSIGFLNFPCISLDIRARFLILLLVLELVCMCVCDAVTLLTHVTRAFHGIKKKMHLNSIKCV